MGHQLPRAAVAAAVALALAGCGGADGDGAPPPVLDVAREQVVEARDADPSGSDPAVDDPADTTASTPAELPPPDPSSFAGAHRVVNLFAVGGGSADGTPTVIDVWGRRTFTHGPVLLADDIGFGEASAYFSTPAGHRVVIVSSGAGPDGDERAALPDPVDDARVTTVFTNGDDAARVATTNVYESGSELGPPLPGDGLGLVVVAAPNLPAFGDDLVASVGGETFFVGDGSADCRAQRIEASGAAATLLGGPDRVEFETAPGPTSISLHPAPSPSGCDQPASIEFTVDVVDGETTTVLLYTTDGTGLETLTLRG